MPTRIASRAASPRRSASLRPGGQSRPPGRGGRVIKRSLLVVVIGLAVAVVAGGCGGDGSSDEVRVVEDFYAAVNAKDVETAMKYVAETAVFINPTGTHRSIAAVKDYLERHQDVTFEHTNFRAEGRRVVYDFVVKDSVGRVVSEGTDGLTVVEDGQIVFDGTERTGQGR